MTVGLKIPGAVIPPRVFTHGVLPGWSHTPAPGISSRVNRLASRALLSWRAAMEHYVGLDVSLKLTAICIVDRTGKIEREGVVSSDPERERLLYAAIHAEDEAVEYLDKFDPAVALATACSVEQTLAIKWETKQEEMQQRGD